MTLPGYDAWLTTDKVAEEADRLSEAEQAAWETTAAVKNLEIGLSNPNHPQHEVYQEWLKEWIQDYEERQA